MLGVRGVLAMCGSSNLVELGGFDSEPEAVCVFAKALKTQRPTVVHLRIGSGFKGVKVLYMLGCCLVADNILRDGA